MAIISRVPGVALLLVGLTLLSGNARAAEPSYDDYVAQVRAGKLDIDYTAFRMAYTASPKYEPYGAARALIGQIKKAYVAGDCPAAMAKAKEVLEVNFVQIDAHMVTASCLKKMGNEEEARRAHAVFIGLVKSVLGSGDGKSPETAFVVIGIDEEYAVMAALSLTLVRQALINHGEETGLRGAGNALFQRRPPAGANGANVAEHGAREEAVDDPGAVCGRQER